jgi:antitoxin component YwqK of YwqJK toxin-antitoxin module
LRKILAIALKNKHILIVLLFLILWIVIENYKSVVNAFLQITREPKGELVNGKKQGEWKTFYLNGKRQAVAHYNNDTLQGQLITYYPNGNRQAKGYYNKGVQVDSLLRYFENGKLSSAEFNDSLGLGQGVFKIYHTNGKLGQLGKMKNGLLDDTSRTYFESGRLKAIQIYMDKHKSGRWLYYNEAGKLVKTELYKNGKPVNRPS